MHTGDCGKRKLELNEWLRERLTVLYVYIYLYIKAWENYDDGCWVSPVITYADMFLNGAGATSLRQFKVRDSFLRLSFIYSL